MVSGQLTRVTSYDLTSKLWSHPPIRVAVLSDLHACGRWMPIGRIREIVAQTNQLSPDMIALPGDFLVGHLIAKKPIGAGEIAEALSDLDAPLGVYASLGNHDWADCPDARTSNYKRSSIEAEFSRVGIQVLKNNAVKLPNGAFVVGLDSAIGHGTTFRPQPRHDPERAFSNVPEDASIILLAHEPDFFLDQNRPVALQISGHTHGGQIGALGILATYPSRYGTMLDYGAKRRDERNLIISAGLGFGGIPIRAGRVSEIAMVELQPDPSLSIECALSGRATGSPVSPAQQVC